MLDLRGKFICACKDLTLKDSNTEAEHKFRDDGSGLWVWDETNGTETLTGGVITGGIHTDSFRMEDAFGGVVVYDSKSFIM